MSQNNNNVAVFTVDGGNKVVRAVREVLATPTPNYGTGSNSPRSNSDGFYALLNGEDPANLGNYSWVSMNVISAGVFSTGTINSTIGGTVFYTAFSANTTAGLAGEIVWLTFGGYDSSHHPTYNFVSPLTYDFDAILTSHIVYSSGSGYSTYPQIRYAWTQVYQDGDGSGVGYINNWSEGTPYYSRSGTTSENYAINISVSPLSMQEYPLDANTVVRMRWNGNKTVGATDGSASFSMPQGTGQGGASLWATEPVGGGEPSASADTTSWTRGSGAVVIQVASRNYYVNTGSGQLLGYFRNWTIDSYGAVQAISAEVSYNIVVPTSCS